MPYIGKAPASGIRSRFIYTATAAQTTFTGADGNGKTLGYTDGEYVDVYLNGVLLDPADYTATSKTSVVLDSGATVSDIVEIVVYDTFSVFNGTFTGDLTVDGDTLFVDSTNNSVGIGTTSPSSFFSDARQLVVGSGSGSQGITISSGTSENSQVFFADGTSGDAAYRGIVRYLHSSDAMAFYTSGANERLRILSGGGITFNGDTATTNALDDYEEGTFSPAYAFTSGGSFNHNIQLGRYTKIGRVVHCTGRVRGAKSSTGSGAINISGFPFTSASTANLHASGTIGRTGNFTNAPKAIFMGTNSTLLAMRQNNSSSSPKSNVSDDTVDGDMGTGASDNDLIFSITYMTS